MNKTEESDKELIQAVREELDRSVEALPSDTVVRLSRARQQALNRYPGRKGWNQFFPYWLTPGRLSFAAVTVVAVSLFTLVPVPAPKGITPDDLEVVTSKEQVEMIQDLDFYRWLAVTGKASSR